MAAVTADAEAAPAHTGAELACALQNVLSLPIQPLAVRSQLAAASRIWDAGPSAHIRVGQSRPHGPCKGARTSAESALRCCASGAILVITAARRAHWRRLICRRVRAAAEAGGIGVRTRVHRRQRSRY